MSSQAQPEIEIAPDLVAASESAAQRIALAAEEAARLRGRFRIALAGGNTPAGLYARLVHSPYRERLPWDAIDVYFTDERCVAPDDPQSNYGMLRRQLLLQAPIAAANVHRIEAELPPQQAADRYQQELQRSFALGGTELPRFDFILLGMGPDGHTASLFPHTAALNVYDRLVAANHVPQLDTNRITLTVPVLNDAREVTFLVAGQDKAAALQGVLEGAREPERLPSQLIQPRAGRLLWLVDRAAAALLSRSG